MKPSGNLRWGGPGFALNPTTLAFSDPALRMPQICREAESELALGTPGICPEPCGRCFWLWVLDFEWELAFCTPRICREAEKPRICQEAGLEFGLEFASGTPRIFLETWDHGLHFQ